MGSKAKILIVGNGRSSCLNIHKSLIAEANNMIYSGSYDMNVKNGWHIEMQKEMMYINQSSNSMKMIVTNFERQFFPNDILPITIGGIKVSEAKCVSIGPLSAEFKIQISNKGKLGHAPTFIIKDDNYMDCGLVTFDTVKSLVPDLLDYDAFEKIILNLRYKR